MRTMQNAYPKPHSLLRMRLLQRQTSSSKKRERVQITLKAGRKFRFFALSPFAFKKANQIINENNS